MSRRAAETAPRRHVSRWPRAAPRAPASAGPCAERGSATVLVVGACAAITTVLAGALAVSGVVRDLHRARGAADLAALAAVGGAGSAGGADCASAERVARANGARLTACGSLPDGTSVVHVAVAVGSGHRNRVWWSVPKEVRASARAGLAAAPES